MPREDSNQSSEDKDVAMLVGKATQYYQDGNLEQAQDFCQQILRKRQRPDAILVLGMIAHEQKEFEVAVEHYQQFLRLVPDNKKTQFKLGVVLDELGHTERAIEHYKNSIGITADDAAAHRRIGYAHSKLQQWQEAIEAYQQSLAIQSDDIATTVKLGNALKAAQRWPESIPLYEQALETLPDDAQVHRHLGAALQKTGQTMKAVQCFEQALRLRPDFTGARNDLALVLRQLGRPEEALELVEEVIELKPDNIDAQINLALTLRQLGRAEHGVERLKRFLGTNPNCGEVYHHISMIKPEQELIPVIEKLISGPKLPHVDAVFCHFALGNLFNACESFDQAFSHFLKGNTLQRATYTHDSDDNNQIFDRTMSVYTKRFFKGKENFGSASRLPVFIVGMPRSGTTLVEQILSSHALVHGAGELETLSGINLSVSRRLALANPRPEHANLFNKKLAEEYAAQYLQELKFHSPTAKRITDKMPVNFARIGLIKTLFPDARIIHCQRNPLDNCTSLFFHCFMALTCSFELTELGQYYLQYQRLMSHWQNLFPGEIFNVQYEELVMDQERVSKQLVDYIGLEWDEKCLEFHDNERPVMTPSNIQVRQPIYKTSINRWKHYEKHLQPLINVLQQAH